LSLLYHLTILVTQLKISHKLFLKLLMIAKAPAPTKQ